MSGSDNIILIGMPGSGKSTVGVVLAKALGMDFIDVDLVICRRNGARLQELVDRCSNEDFLRLEAEAALSLECAGSVVATGGSMVSSPDAMEYLKSLGTVVYIRVPLDDLSGRIKNLQSRGIAFLPGETLADLYVRRCPLYEEWADVTVDSDNGDRIEDVVQRIKSETDGK